MPTTPKKKHDLKLQHELTKYGAMYEAINSLSENQITNTPNPEKTNVYIHYTSLSSFQAMVKPFCEDDKPYIKLFASRMQFLNDSKEYMLGCDVVKKLVKSDTFAENIFVSCFCGKRDLLSQWKYYGKDSGIAMDFDFGSNCKLVWWGQDETLKDGFKITPHRVLYKSAENLETEFTNFQQAVNNVSSTMPDSEIATAFIPFCKDPAFEEETESRLIFMPVTSGPKKEQTKTKYYVTNGKIVPQFEVRVYYAKKQKNRIPLRSVMIGPGYNQLLNFNAVIHMLDKTNKNIPFFDKNDVDVKNLSKPLSLEPNPEASTSKNSKKYVTYKTRNGILVQLSPTSFRS